MKERITADEMVDAIVLQLQKIASAAGVASDPGRPMSDVYDALDECMTANTGAADITSLYEAIFALMAQSRKGADEAEKRSESCAQVYFIQRADGNIKIGYSYDPLQRKGQLQTQYDCEMTLLATLKGARVKEKELHGRFAAARVKGEWFAPSHELMSFIKEVALNHRAPSLNFQ